MRLGTWNPKVEEKCTTCKSKNVGRENPSVFVLLYFPSLFLFKHVNFHCFDCGKDWDDYYFK